MKNWSFQFNWINLPGINAGIAASTTTDAPTNDTNNFIFAIVIDNQWSARISLITTNKKKNVWQFLRKWKIEQRRCTFFGNLFIHTWHESCFPFPAQTIFGVIRDDRYFMLRHWLNVRIGTSTCCTTLGNAPPSVVLPANMRIKLNDDLMLLLFTKLRTFVECHLPQPTAMPVFPAGSKSSDGKQTGIIFFEKLIGFRSFNNAMSWLYVLESKYRCLITALTARILASASLITVWSWSPKMIRILDRFNRRTQCAAVNTYSFDINDAPQWNFSSVIYLPKKK